MKSGVDYPVTSAWKLITVPLDSGECLRCMNDVLAGDRAYIRAVPTDRIEAIHEHHGHPDVAFPHFGTTEEKRAWMVSTHGPYESEEQ